MKYKIIHQTEYIFNSKVFFEPHVLRFKPKNAPNIQVESFNIQMDPMPKGLSEQLDPENNFIHNCWFEGMHHKLSIRAELHLLSADFNPFNFIIFPDSFLTIPFSYTQPWKEQLLPSIKKEVIGQALIDYGQNILTKSNASTIDFLTKLNQQIHQDFIVEIRETGEPYHPDKTYELKSGSCRDLTWMEIHLLRHMGIASRFVSGYFYLPMEKDEFDLHAWVEVFIPGAGWIGFDPSHGMVAGASHIPVASSAHYDNTMAVTGSVRGSAYSELKTKLVIEVL